MSRQNDESKINKARGKAKSERKNTGSKFISFHPTEGEKKELQDAAYDLAWAIDVIASRVAEGCSFKLVLRDDGSAVGAMVWDAQEDWQDRYTITAWHAECERATIGLAYALTKRYPDYPSIKPNRVQLAFDW